MTFFDKLKLRAISSVQKKFRTLGIDIRRYHGGANEEASLAFALKHFGVTRLIDVGANEGQFGMMMRNYGFRGHMISFEPLPDAHAILSAEAAKHAPWTVARRCAVGERNGMTTLNVASNLASSSIRMMGDLHHKAAPGIHMVGQIETPLQTLDAALEQNEFDAMGAVLKIDTQGYEKQVLDGAPETLAKIKGLQIELSLDQVYVGQEDWFYFLDVTRNYGFKLWNLAPELYDKSTGQLLQVNATFFRV